MINAFNTKADNMNKERSIKKQYNKLTEFPVP